jgi:hypothetical protein
VVKSSLVLFWARMGSINAWEQVGQARFWQCWLEEPTFSADTLGRVHALLAADLVRDWGLPGTHAGRASTSQGIPKNYCSFAGLVCKSEHCEICNRVKNHSGIHRRTHLETL